MQDLFQILQPQKQNIFNISLLILKTITNQQRTIQHLLIINTKL